MGPILFSYYEESLVSSKLNSKLFWFHSLVYRATFFIFFLRELFFKYIWIFSEIRNSVLWKNYANATLKVLFNFGNHRTFSLSANIKYVLMYLVRDIKPLNHESSSSQYFSTKFSQLEQLKKKTNFFIAPKQFWTNEKFIFIFISSNNKEKLGTHNKIFDSAVWCHEQDVKQNKWFFSNPTIS